MSDWSELYSKYMKLKGVTLYLKSKAKTGLHVSRWAELYSKYMEIKGISLYPKSKGRKSVWRAYHE